MGSRLLAAVLLLTVTGLAQENPPLELNDRISLPHIAGWEIADSNASPPFHLVNEPGTAELLIFESVLVGDELVGDTAEFRLTVEQIVETIFMDLPDVQIISNTGYLHDSLARFVVEFTSTNESIEGALYHRFEGVLIRLSKDTQVLYSLWGKSAKATSGVDIPVIRKLQAGFVYGGPIEDTVFVDGDMPLWYYFAPLFAIFLLLMVIRRRQAALRRIRFEDDERVWRCQCGRLNHERQRSCRRCGQHRPTGATV